MRTHSHPGLTIHKHRRLYEEPFLSLDGTLSSDQKLGSLLLSRLNEVENLGVLSFGDLRMRRITER